MNKQTTIVCRKMTEQWQKWLLFFWWGNFSIVSFYTFIQSKRTLHKIFSLQSLLLLQQTKEIVTFCLQRRIDVKTFLFSTSFSFFFYSSVKGTCLWDARTTFLHVVRKDIPFLIIFKLSTYNKCNSAAPLSKKMNGQTEDAVWRPNQAASFKKKEAKKWNRSAFVVSL